MILGKYWNARYEHNYQQRMVHLRVALRCCFFYSISKILRGREKLSLEAEAFELFLGKKKHDL